VLVGWLVELVEPPLASQLHLQEVLQALEAMVLAVEDLAVE